MKDPIVEEVRRVRDELASECGYDVRKIAEASRQRQKSCGHKVVDLSGEIKPADSRI
jgi:hypothetical protein